MLDANSLDLLFRAARTQNGFLDKPVSDEQLKQIHELMKWAPTSANCQPARILFLRSAQAKQRLEPALGASNVAKTMSAPVCALIAYDTRFYEHLPKMFPHNQDAINWFKGADKKAIADITAFRNGSLQGAYFLLAARAVGLDCGPMSGFDNAKVDPEFFPDGRFKSNFLCNLGYGDPAKVFARSPRFEFEEQCSIL
ncbi:MAG: malonic semialdehyde reductase [Betaproteobacteria bacterium]|nr:malonic semialdehyde reductase [Betaproteobacteria bacterium]